MEKSQIKNRLDQIMVASEQIMSVGAHASLQNAQQLLGIQRMASEIWQLLNAPEKEESSGG